jgi:hypothetical protein
MTAINERKLVVLLNDFKKNRRLSLESKAMIKPFVGMSYTFTFIFESVSKTFSQKYGGQYAGGKTVIAQIIDSELMCSVLFSVGQDDWLSGLSVGHKFKKEVGLLGLDNLYGRVVFGHPLKTEMEPRALGSKAEIELSENEQKEESMTESEGMKGLYISHLQTGIIKRKNRNDSTRREPKQGARTLNKFREISLKLRGNKKLRLPKSGTRRRWSTFIGSTIPLSQDEESLIPPLIKNILASVAFVMFIFFVYLFY